MAKTSLAALNDVLFNQLEALTNPDLRGEDLQQEIERSKTVSQIAKQITDSANTQLRAAEFAAEYLGKEIVPSKEVFALEENVS